MTFNFINKNSSWWSFIVCFLTLNLFFNLKHNIILFNWIFLKIFNVNISLNLSYKWELIIFFVINFITIMVLLFSYNYMNFSLDKNLFYVYLFFFWVSMLIIVSSGNIFVLLIGWEGVGIISYLLINYWNLRIESNKSSIKALLLNKIGDFSIVFAGISFFNVVLSPSNVITNYISIFLKYESYSLLNFNFNMFSIPLFFLVLGAISKSAQLVFCMWLPDAMEGPTPVSALIHSSTMVAAGYILLIKYYSIVQLYETYSLFLVLIGLLTNWLSSLVLLTTSDIKNTLANSTTAQIAYMITLLGLNFPISSVVQFVAHAFYKSLSFLAFGSLIYQIKDNQDSRLASVLNTQNPLMFVCLLIGLLSFIGLPNCISHFGKLDLFNIIVAYNYSYNGFVLILLFSQIINFLGGLSLILLVIYYKANLKINKNLIYNKYNWDNSHLLSVMSKLILSSFCLILGNYIYTLSLFLKFNNTFNYQKIFADSHFNEFNLPSIIFSFTFLVVLILLLGEVSRQSNFSFSSNSSVNNWYLDINLIKIVLVNFKVSVSLSTKLCNYLTHPSSYLKLMFK